MTVFSDITDIGNNVMGFISLSSEMFLGSKSSNNGEFFPVGTWKLVRIKEIIQL